MKNLTIREQFPILSQSVNGKPLVYFDNAATTQKPQSVIDSIVEYYTKYNANIHRGVHYLSNYCTSKNENAREKVRSFINAKHSHEIIFTRGTTESINLIANSFGNDFLNKDDEVIISTMEHHSNIVPWQMICDKKQAHLKVINIDKDGNLDLAHLKNLITKKVKIISLTHVSNTLGTINPVKEIIALAHKYDIPVLVDGAQAIQHISVDVQDLDADFYVFSGHKMYGPTGIGVLYGKESLLNQITPWQGGGEMIDNVTFEKTTYNKLPFKFEAGTPNYIDAIALIKSIEFIEEVGIENISDIESKLLDYATQQVVQIEGLRIIGQAKQKSSVLSFVVDGIHPYDIGVLLDKTGVAVRTGNHCTQPLHDFFGINGTVRASFAVYNTIDEVDVFIKNLKQVVSMLR